MNALRIAECTSRYGASVLANGASPEQARAAALECAGELAAVASIVRRAVRLSGAERRGLARILAGRGMTRREIAERLGVSERAVYGYLRP